jgi:tetratricopeptide (TPR) repeat protein
MRLIQFAFLCSFLAPAAAAAQLSPDNVGGAYQLLSDRQKQNKPGTNLDRARTLFQQHRYEDAQKLVDAALRAVPGDYDWLELRVRLLIQAWRLDLAKRVASTLPNGTKWVGRIQLLEKDYKSALASAKAAQAANPEDAEAYLLEADVHFWNQEPEKAEAPLRRALELDPLNADARFAYGYAIWRRVDARQLPQMAAQWNLALAIDPLHYITHWHFGNGHTHLTYADYAQPTDTTVRRLIRGIDSLIAGRRIDEALQRARALGREYPHSLLPDLTRGSIFYMAVDLPRATRLDSAQAIFSGLLARKPNYGPAHNALAAVIKQRQFTYHAKYDSLEAEIARQPVPTDSAFYREFRNIRYYPGDRVIKEAVQQLGPALAYIPFIARMGYTYVIPPLHHDLSEAMGTSFFRTSTTFDNRQWMDIRGSGGDHASASIEYVERGSHQERVVLLHEYVHQFHGAVLTDQQSRRIRQLYYDAMAANRTLDYYAANNESEFFAQAYEAYLSPVKVHPLNHKAMNTRADLISKDPALFAFLDTLITENRAYLAGDPNAMKKNWAQVYLTLARRTRTSARGDSALLRRAHAYLDTAMAYVHEDVPQLLERAAVFQAQQRWRDAEAALGVAEAHGRNYAPVYEARADFLRVRAAAEKKNAYVPERMALYRRALDLETDLAERADLNRSLRELYYEQADYAHAIAIAQMYADSAPAPSTYLRDRKDEAAAFAAELRSRMGHPETRFFEELVARKPQNFMHRAQAVRVFWEMGDEANATRLLQESERILGAGSGLPISYQILRAAYSPRTATTSLFIDSMLERGGAGLTHDDRMRVLEFAMHAGRTEAAVNLIPPDSAVLTPRQRADFLYLRGRAEVAVGRNDAAMRWLRQALELNPYHVTAREMLVQILRDTGKLKEAWRVGRDDVAQMDFGSLYHQEIRNLLSER